LADTLIETVLGEIHDQAVVEFTQALVRIPSVNGEEAEAADFVARACRQGGLEVTVRDVHDGRPNVLAVLPGRKSNDIGLLLHGHTDTVPFLGMKNPLSGEVVNGHIWGRGSVDQKGGLAASVMALLALARADVPLAKGVAVAAVIDEESEHRGSMALVDEGFRADFAIVTEPSDLRLLVGCKGTAPIRITLTGVLAHGSNPWLGVNAIEKAARVVIALGEIEPRAVEVPGVGRMQGSINVGLIEGGTAYNNVADRCSLWLDRRMVPGETQATVLEEIRALLDDLAAQDPDFKAMAEIARPDWRWERIKERGLNPAMVSLDSQIVAAVRMSHQRVVGEPVELGYTHGYMDMDFLINDLGIPTVNYGPGDTAYSHTDHERLRVDHLLAATRVYALTALILAGG